jgi:hypothetical protein
MAKATNKNARMIHTALAGLEPEGSLPASDFMGVASCIEPAIGLPQ